MKPRGSLRSRGSGRDATDDLALELHRAARLRIAGVSAAPVDPGPDPDHRALPVHGQWREVLVLLSRVLLAALPRGPRVPRPIERRVLAEKDGAERPSDLLPGVHDFEEVGGNGSGNV